MEKIERLVVQIAYLLIISTRIIRIIASGEWRKNQLPLKKSKSPTLHVTSVLNSKYFFDCSNSSNKWLFESFNFLTHENSRFSIKVLKLSFKFSKWLRSRTIWSTQALCEDSLKTLMRIHSFQSTDWSVKTLFYENLHNSGALVVQITIPVLLFADRLAMGTGICKCIFSR